MGNDLHSLRRIQQFDCNLLVVFAALAETQHVGRAANLLGLTQPAVSHALTRLRDQLRDPLFVRAPSGMLPTPRAEALVPVVRELLVDITGRVLEVAEFSSERLERTFVVRTTGLVEAILLPEFLAEVSEVAPRVRVVSRPATPEFPRDELESGRIDLAVAGFFSELPQGVRTRVLARDRLVAAVRAGHPRLGGKRRRLTLDAFCAEAQLMISPGGTLDGQSDRLLRREKRERRVVAGVAEFMSAAFVIARTDLLLVAPESLLKGVARPLGLVVFPVPLDLSPIVIQQYWHERQHNDPAHRWFRELLQSSAEIAAQSADH